jgi:hypothetical protein
MHLLLTLLLGCQETSIHKADPADTDCANLLLFTDADGDGFGAGEAVPVCEDATGFAATADDCDDTTIGVAPGVAELCDGVDQNCDGLVDEGAIGPEWYPDGDGDGFGARVGAPVSACVQPEGTAGNDDDCDDLVATTFPGADELCNVLDDDCDLTIDEDAIDAPTWYRDNDGDGWGIPNPSIAACEQPNRSATNSLDCDDGDPTLTDVCPPPAPPPAGQAVCNGGQVYTFSNVTGQPELHVISVYEPTASGRVEVWLQRPGTMTVLLSSYEEVDWVLFVDPGVTLNGVLVNGYDAQTLQGLPPGVQTQTRSFAQTGTNFGNWCGYSWPYNGGGCDTNLLIAGVEAFTQQTTTGFVGCYTGEQFVVQ